MENQHLNTAAGVVGSHRPKIVSAAGDTVKVVEICADIGTWYYRPRVPVPMEGKGVEVYAGVDVNPDSPNVVAAARHCINEIFVRASVGAWHLGPCVPIPMQCKGPLNEELPIGVLATGPHVVAAAGHCIKEVSACARIGGYHLGPGAAIPVQRQRPSGLAAGIIVHPYGPHVVAATCSSVKVIVVRACIRTWYQQPRAPVPMHCQRPKAGCSK